VVAKKAKRPWAFCWARLCRKRKVRQIRKWFQKFLTGNLGENFLKNKGEKMKIEKSADIAKRPVEVEGAKDAEIRWLISKEDGAENFAMRMFEIKPGGFTPLHTHPHEHEIFAVEGEGVFVYEGKEYEFSRDYVIFVPPNKEHQFKNRGDSILRLLCLIPASAV